MDGYIFSEMKRYRRRFLILFLILVALWVTYIVANSPYILNRFIDHPNLDISNFSKSVRTLQVGEPFELHRSDDLNLSSNALKGSSYWEGDHYEFVVPISDLSPVDLTASDKKNPDKNSSFADITSAKAWITQIGGKKVLVVTAPEFNPENVTQVTGIFTSIPYVMCYHLANKFEGNPEYEVCEYMLDTRGIEMESEIFDITFSVVLLALIVFLALKLFRQYMDYRRTPTYKQLAKYGEIDITQSYIEKELKEAQIKDKQYICENWILSRDTFGLKIVKNHIKHGSFKY